MSASVSLWEAMGLSSGEGSAPGLGSALPLPCLPASQFLGGAHRGGCPRLLLICSPALPHSTWRLVIVWHPPGRGPDGAGRRARGGRKKTMGADCPLTSIEQGASLSAPELQGRKRETHHSQGLLPPQLGPPEQGKRCCSPGCAVKEELEARAQDGTLGVEPRGLVLMGRVGG